MSIEKRRARIADHGSRSAEFRVQSAELAFPSRGSVAARGCKKSVDNGFPPSVPEPQREVAAVG